LDKLTEKVEQCYCIRFCVKLGDSQVEIIHHEWYTTSKMAALYDKPSTSACEVVIDHVRTLVMQDCQIMIRELADEVIHSC
jgi:hypothetical protein